MSRRRNRPIFIARVRLEPQDPKRELVGIFEHIIEVFKVGDGFKFLEPDLENDKAAYLMFEGFRRKNWKIAKYVMERLIDKKLLKPLNMTPASVTIEVREVKEGDNYPEHWFIKGSLDNLGNTKVKVAE